MFTGLIEATGEVETAIDEPGGGDVDLALESRETTRVSRRQSHVSAGLPTEPPIPTREGREGRDVDGIELDLRLDAARRRTRAARPDPAAFACVEGAAERERRLARPLRLDREASPERNALHPDRGVFDDQVRGARCEARRSRHRSPDRGGRGERGRAASPPRTRGR